MTDEQALPAAGWYPDPDSSSNVRYWDGAVWTQYSAAPQAPAWKAPVLGRGFTALSGGIVVGLFVMVVVLVTRVALYIWGWSLIDNVTEAGDSLNTFDNLDNALTVVLAVTLLATGVTWMIWQQKLATARRFAGLRHSPAMHAWAWVIPVFSLWGPFQNVADLWRSAFPDRPVTYLRWWWAAWLAFQVGVDIDDRGAVNSIGAFKAELALGILTSVIGLVAAFMARHIVRTLTAARSAAQPTLDLRAFRAG